MALNHLFTLESESILRPEQDEQQAELINEADTPIAGKPEQ